MEKRRSTIQSIGRYQIQEELGRGGMGIVYRAHEPALNRPVALKVLSPALAGQPGFISRLRHEAASAARLRHPNIIHLYDFIEDEYSAYLVMEYVPGRSLSQILEKETLSFDRIIRILYQIASALDYAHTIAIIHRDVKPNNILIGPDDHAMLVDFGLAEMMDDAMITPDGIIIGTPNYMSPEQASGRDETPKSDQYSLAAVAFEMLTGVSPFNYHNTPAIIHAHIYELPPLATENNPSLPVQVNHILNRALSKSPYERYPSVKDFIDDLNDALKPRPQTVKMGWMKKAIPWLAGILLITSALFFYLFWSGKLSAFFPEPDQYQILLPQKILWRYDPGFVGGPDLVSAGGKLVVGGSDGQLTVLEEDNGSVLWRTRDDEKFYGYPSANPELVFVGDQFERVEGLSIQTGGAVWSTKVIGKVQMAPILYQNKLITVTSKGYIFVLNSGNGRILWSRPLEIGILSAGVAPGYLIIGYKSSLVALDIESGMIRWEYKVDSSFTTQPVMDNSNVIIGTEQGHMNMINLDDGVELWRFQAKGEIKASPVIQYQVLYVADRSGRITSIDLLNRKKNWETQLNHSIVSAPVESGKYLFIGTSSGKLFILLAADGSILDEIQFKAGIENSLVKDKDVVFIRADQIYALKPDMR